MRESAESFEQEEVVEEKDPLVEPPPNETAEEEGEIGRAAM